MARHMSDLKRREVELRHALIKLTDALEATRKSPDCLSADQQIERWLHHAHLTLQDTARGRWNINTGDIPEAGASWFKKARLVQPRRQS
jgi:hypothetical protein